MTPLWHTALLALLGQIAGPAQPTQLSGVELSGVEPSTQIRYALITLSGRRIDPAAGGTPLPRLTAQCSQDPAGKLRFELLADFGTETPLLFLPPWRPSANDLYPHRQPRLPLTMDFLGYTKVKPVRRQWEALDQLPGELRYATPGLSSANMEPIAFYLQYLKALPTLRLTAPDNRTIEFETTAWQQALHQEPLCHAAGL